MHDKYRECDQVWRLAGMAWPGNSLCGTSSLLVALIVLLRLLMVKQPTNYRSIHKAASRIGCIFVWVFPLGVSSIKFIISLPPLYDANIYRPFLVIENFTIVTAPILLTVLLYAILLCSLNPQSSMNQATIARVNALAKMTRGVVVGLLVCNVPGLLHLAHVLTMIGRGKKGVLTSNTVVRTASSFTIFDYKCL